MYIKLESANVVFKSDDFVCAYITSDNSVTLLLGKEFLSIHKGSKESAVKLIDEIYQSLLNVKTK